MRIVNVSCSVCGFNLLDVGENGRVDGENGWGGGGGMAGGWSRPATNMTGASWVRSSGGYEFMAAGELVFVSSKCGRVRL